MFVAGVNVGNVHLEHRPLERLDGIENRHRTKRIAGRIDDDGIGGLPRGLDPVDQLALMVRLVKRQLDPEFTRVLFAGLPHLRQRRGPVDVRLAHAEQIEVGTVQDHQSLHGGSFRMVGRIMRAAMAGLA